MANPFGPSDDSTDISNNATDEIKINRHERGAIHQKPLSAFISSVPDELCGPTAEFNPFQFWNVDGTIIEQWSDQINDAIQTAVNRHHRGFNQATTEFDEILSAFHDSEVKFKRLVSNLLEARKLLHNTRGKNGKTASIAKQWQSFESYKRKLKELDKIEYILEIPQIFEKYLSKKQFIHATVLLEDALTLYATSLTKDSYDQLQGTQQSILDKKNDLEKLLRQQLYQQIYFKTNSLRSSLLHPPKRKMNKNILNLLNLQKEIMLGFKEEKKQSMHNLSVNNVHSKGAQSVHYDTLASLHKQTPSIGHIKMGMSHKKASQSMHSNQSTSLQDPYKIIVPTYKSFRNLENAQNQHSKVEHLLVAETTDEYLALASNNNNYSDEEQPLFLTLCVTAIDKLGRSVGAKTNLHKSLDSELREIIDREIYEVCNAWQQQMISGNQMSSVIEPEEQSLMLLGATQNVFKIFQRVLKNHKCVIEVFNSRDKSDKDKYSVQKVWNGIQKAILNNLLIKYLDQMQESKNRKEQKIKDSAVEQLLGNELTFESDDNILKVRSASPSPQPINGAKESGNKSFGNKLKNSKFFKRRRGNTVQTTPNATERESKEESKGNNDERQIGTDLFSNNGISNSLHDIAMDGLTFSVADSNVHSIVLDSAGMTISKGKHNKAQDSEFMQYGHNTKKRISLSQAVPGFNLSQISGGGRGHQTGARALNLSPHLNKTRERGATGLDAFSSANAQKNRQARNRGMTFQSKAVKPAMKSRDRTKRLNLIEASPYHVTKLYKPIIHFVETCEWRVLGDSYRMEHGITVDKDVDLREFLLSFVRKTFIPNMQAEAYFQMSEILLGNQCMDSVKLANEPLLLLKSTSGIFDLIKTLFEYYIVLPVFDNTEFVNMIHVILSKVVDTYTQGIDEISEILISKDLILNNSNQYLGTLSKWSLCRIFDGSDSVKDVKDNTDNLKAYEINKSSKKVDIYSYEYIRQKHSDIAIDTFLNHQIDGGIDMSLVNGLPTFNTEYFNKLALISRGLFWSHKKINSELINNRRKIRNKSKEKELVKISEFLALNFSPKAEECISIIRMEMRAQIVCLLSHISSNNYWMPEDSIINKPQDFIIILNKLLQSCEGKLFNCLPQKFIRFLFIELAYFICDIIIYQIPLVKSGKINHVGYKQLYKNTFSLQQNLTTITQKGMEKCFDRAQKYLKLSQKTPKDIQKIQDIKNKKYSQDKEKYAAYNFTKDQYDAIATVAKLSNAHKK